MNHLIAKTKGRKGAYYKVISSKSIFALPNDLANTKEYEASYKLEDEEWFVINEFSDKTFCLDFLKPKFISTDFEQISSKAYKVIDFICSIQKDKYFFQKITPNQLVQKKWLSLSTKITFVEDEDLIIVNSLPDAIYDKPNDRLYFKKLPTISGIFKGIEVLYREATDEETKTFLSYDFLSPQNNYTAQSVKTANRKRIAMAMDSLKKYDDKQRQNVFKYIQEYCKGVKFEDNAFKIETEDDLKLILYGIEQRYYTTLLGNEKRLANSITKLS